MQAFLYALLSFGAQTHIHTPIQISCFMCYNSIFISYLRTIATPCSFSISGVVIEMENAQSFL